ncbi:MAG: hypothetical protein ACOYM9_12925 [Bradymonadia bacterium]
MLNELRRISEQIGDFHGDVDRRFDDVNRRFDDVSRRFDDQLKLFKEEVERGDRRALEQLTRFQSLEQAVDHIIKSVDIPPPEPPSTSSGRSRKPARSKANLSVVPGGKTSAPGENPPKGRRRANPSKPSPSKPKKPRPKKPRPKK